MTDPVLAALHSSTQRLSALLGPLPDEVISGPAYPSEWSIADVLSHLGSGSVIAARRLADGLAGTAPPDGFNEHVWAAWDAKPPRAKVDDALAALASLDASLSAVAEDDRARFQTAFGPVTLDWNRFVGMRLNEQLLHEWDVAVALDPASALQPDGVALVVDNLEAIAGFAGKPAGRPRTITVATTGPDRRFEVVVTVGGVAISAGAARPAGAASDLSMPAEAFIRLVYGRLDPAHTPAAVAGEQDALDQLRVVFPGF